MATKTKWSIEGTRIGRRNGWARQAIVRETSGKCYVVMVESKAFGSLKKAKEYADALAGEKKP